MDEAPSAISSSTVRCAGVTTTVAAKTAAVIQGIDEDESTWIFGMITGSRVQAVTDRDEGWDELVLDSGSVSTACPYAWCAEIHVDDKEKAYLQDIQQRRISVSWITGGTAGDEGSFRKRPVHSQVRRGICGVPSGFAGKDDRDGIHVQLR